MQENSTPSSSKSYWRFSKHDFFPEPSFDSFSSYKASLFQTPHRLINRLFARSTDAQELVNFPIQSENPLRKCLTWWDLMWLSFGNVVGSGVFGITGQEARIHAGPSIVMSYALSGLSALLSAFCYTEFAVDVPVAGGSFSFLRIELGDFVAFIAAGGFLCSILLAASLDTWCNILVEAVVGAAGLGRSWSSYFSSIIKNDPDFLRIRVNSLANGFNLLDPLAVFILLIANGIAITGTRKTSVINWASSTLTACVLTFIIVVGFIHSKTENLSPFFPYGVGGMFQAAAVVYWSYTGFDMVATMAEETKHPARDIPLGLVGSMSMISIVYCLMALALVMMVRYTDIDANAAFSVAFDKIGMRWAKYLVSIIALKGMTTSLMVGALGQARYTTQIARAHMIPPWFALVHPKTQTPIYATLLTTSLSMVLALFSSLDLLSSVFSFSTLFIFMLMAVALIVRRYCIKDVTPKGDLVKFFVCLVGIIGSSIGVSVVWNLKHSRWIGYVVAGVLWFLGTLGMQLLLKQRKAKVWGVPLVPWIPSVSIAMNLFLIGSLGYIAFLRFIICCGAMIAYYLFFGLHATYDVAQQMKEEAKVEEGKQGLGLAAS